MNYTKVKFEIYIPIDFIENLEKELTEQEPLLLEIMIIVFLLQK